MRTPASKTTGLIKRRHYIKKERNITLGRKHNISEDKQDTVTRKMGEVCM